MARPIKEGMDYFPHDVDAMSDDKIEILRALYGNNGYVFYFGLLERIYRQPDFEYDISDAETIQILSKKFLISVEEFNLMLQTALKYHCFDSEYYEQTGYLTSNGIKKRGDVVVKKREVRRNRYTNGVCGVVCDDKTMSQTTQSKVKESKVKESKENNISPLFPPGAVGNDKPKKKTISVEDVYASESFQRFWNAYPKKDNKRNAALAWKALNPKPELVDEILTGIEGWKQNPQWNVRKYIPNPEAFIHGEKWNDDSAKKPKKDYSGENDW